MRKLLLSVCLCLTGLVTQASHFKPVSTNAVMQICHDDERLYILYYHALEVYDKATGTSTVYHLAEDYSDRMGLTALAVHGGTVWVGDENGRVTAIRGNRVDTWTYMTPGTDSGNGLRSIGISNIVFDSAGRMYLGGDNSLAVVQEPGEARYIDFPSPYLGTEVWRMAIDRDDAIWISATAAHSGNGLMKYTAEAGLVFFAQDFGTPLFAHSDVMGMAVAADNALWFGIMGKDSDSTGPSGYNLVRQEEGKPAVVSDNLPELPADMTFDAAGRLWMLPSIPSSRALQMGIWQDVFSVGPLMVFADGGMTEYPFDLPDGHLAYCLDTDGDTVYIGTDGGVVTFSDGRFQPLTTSYGVAAIGHQESQAAPAAVISLQGCRLQSLPAKGIYVKDGKKHVRH